MNREKFLNYNQERNENVKERYELAIERIAQIADDSILEEPYRTYFVQVSEIFLQLDRLWNGMDCSGDWTVKEIPEGNPYKTVLSILYSEVISKRKDVYRGRLDLLTIDAELFLEIYCIFQDEPSVKQVEQAIYWHNSDYADIFEEDLVERILGITPSYEEELLWSQSESKSSDALVPFVIEQYLSYQDCGNLQGKIVPMCFDVGFESLAKGVIQCLREKQIQVVICPMEDLCSELLYDRVYEKNKYAWMNRQYKERRVQVLRTQLERYKEKTKICLSPLVLYRGETDERNVHTQQNPQRQRWKEYFEQQDEVLYSYIPYKTCIVL